MLLVKVSCIKMFYFMIWIYENINLKKGVNGKIHNNLSVKMKNFIFITLDKKQKQFLLLFVER